MEIQSTPSSPPPSSAAAPSSSREPATPAAVAKVSPGEGAFSPPKTNSPRQDHGDDDDDAAAAAVFGPPPAFPGASTQNTLGKRKRTLMAVSTSGVSGTGGSALEDLSSDDEDDEDGSKSAKSGSKKHQHSQMIHRIQVGQDAMSPIEARVKKENEEDDSKKYSDAMLLASLSDVDSPKKAEEAASSTKGRGEAANHEKKSPEEQNPRSPPRSAPSSHSSSNAPTPLRSNVNPNPTLNAESVVKPFALLPRPEAKRPKYESPGNNHISSSHNYPNYHKGTPSRSSLPPQSPDGRDPKAAKTKKEGGVREGYPPYPPTPSYSSQPPPGAYPGYTHLGYPYPSHPGAHPSPYGAPPGAPPGSVPPPHGYPGYPPYNMSAYPPTGHPQGPPPHPVMAHPSPYHPRAGYYPGGPPGGPGAPPPLTSSGPTSQGGPSLERWGSYHSPKSNKSSNSGPEPVRSGADQSRPPAPYHPMSSDKNPRSHVVPSEEGDGGPGGSPSRGDEYKSSVYGRGGGPLPYGPPPGYDPRYPGGPPPTTREGYYPSSTGPGAPPPVEYNAISRDESSPPRTTSSSAGSHHEYSPAPVNTPPRGSSGHYDYYHDQGPPPPGPPSGYGAPPSSSQGYHPDTPPGSYSSYYGGGPPPPPPSSSGHGGDPYEPYDYNSAPSSSNEAHYHVPATVSNEIEPSYHPHHGPPPPSHPHHAGPPPPSSAASSSAKYHQFRKGGRSIHSEPVILRKKFSWRNYPELEEYLIANRTDYLRHSALNYTAEQKHFNNRLTEGLLELAAKLNYVFDETCFNFVAVRDRIRCYYKSYVQSSKKRGVVVGFSKRGPNDLVKKDDMHRGDDLMGES
mmetsp:Transcript_11378/g.18279  ORF Transcript_11378/g.18279 Transcript_11378/m.18279 type:complete len:844 (-) Transcript_11378:171-2702(-)|eukprot:CAMPEP_0183718540 /NCGR_PEP_ID=MMETSP0737-20130205/11763_1 /TAXON_ID=385413 /ORGANISM="Thalassiosira miniscula, Strain CCMP1093" /LENGTH=843 /DNA_ID=CAMNT_0025948117 /DNA_START=339 /DNA_END=2870 /DNA_ORIENTATION=-